MPSEVTLDLVAVIGSATPPGRLRRAVADGVVRAGGNGRLLDLGELNVSFADGRPLESYGDDTSAVVAAIAGARAVVLASPVYRGTVTGVLKNLLDHVPVDALEGKPVGIVAMGATDHHLLGVDWHLRDVLAWFGALTAPSSVYLTSRDFTDGVPSDGAAAKVDALLSTVGALAGALGGRPLGPRPLAAGRS